MGSIEDQVVIEAIVNDDVDALDRVLANGGNPDTLHSDGRRALEVAIECDNVAAVSRLIAAGANVNAAHPDGWTVLHMAVDLEGDNAHQHGTPMDLRHVRPLLDAGANPTAALTGSREGRTPIDMARDYGHARAVEALERAAGNRD